MPSTVVNNSKMSSIRRRVNESKPTSFNNVKTNDFGENGGAGINDNKALSIEIDHDVKKEKTSMLQTPPSSLRNNIISKNNVVQIIQHMFHSNSTNATTTSNDNNDYNNLLLENEKLKQQMQLLEKTLDNNNNFKNNHHDHDHHYSNGNDNFKEELHNRSKWLVGLLFFQSCSGFILSRNERLLHHHPVIIYFLTMLVGAGGNAGNQASVRVIRSLALGTLNIQSKHQLQHFLKNEIILAFILSILLSIAGFIRAIVFHTPMKETIAITVSLFCIVFLSVTFGVMLPLFLHYVMNIDPANSSTMIQVVMDILGVFVTVIVSTLLLDTSDFVDYFYYLF